jgi:hypothetical protein
MVNMGDRYKILGFHGGFTLMMEAIRSSEMSVITSATGRLAF